MCLKESESPIGTSANILWKPFGNKQNEKANEDQDVSTSNEE